MSSSVIRRLIACLLPLKGYLFYIHWLNGIKNRPNKIHKLTYTEGKLFYGNQFSIKHPASSLQQGTCNETLLCNEKSIPDQAFLEHVTQNTAIKFIILQPDCSILQGIQCNDQKAQQSKLAGIVKMKKKKNQAFLNAFLKK